MPKIVQFTHPGNEHNPDEKNGNHKKWNDKNHKRKFLLCDGEYIENDEKNRGKLLFWGEWEPPTFVEKFATPPNPFYPKWLHKPELPLVLPPLENRKIQNTDPFVFGESFKYFICKQLKNDRPTSLAKLECGSIILFGSTGNQNKEDAFFNLDTVFVVSTYIEYDALKPDALDREKRISEEYRNISLRRALPMQLREENRPTINSLKVRLYFGATYDNPVDNMYSFTPSKKWENNEMGFPRVRLKQDDFDFISNNLNAAPKYTEKSFDDIKLFWAKLREMTREQGYLEGVRFDCPTQGTERR